MSFISKAKTDFEDIEGLFKRVLKAEPSWAAIAEADIAYAAPSLTIIVGLAGGPAASTEFAAAIALVQKDIVLVTKFIQDVEASGSVAGALSDLKIDLAALLQVGAVKNSSKVQMITAYVNAFIGEIDAILLKVPATA